MPNVPHPVLAPADGRGIGTRFAWPSASNRATTGGNG